MSSFIKSFLGVSGEVSSTTKPQLYNLTPHSINICDDDGKVIHTIPSSGHNVRVDSKPQEHVEDLTLNNNKIPVFTPPSYTKVTGLPDDINGRDIIVSSITGDQFVKENLDFPQRVLVPDTGPNSCVRDEAGKILGVKRFIRLNRPFPK